MRQRTGPNGSADRHVKEIKRQTRRRFSAEEKIRIVLDAPEMNQQLDMKIRTVMA